jgi:hypothetical protein
VRGHGHGIYTQNNDPVLPKKITDVISLNNFAMGMKAFGEQGYAVGYAFDGVISFNNGSNAAYTGSPAIGGGNVLGPSHRQHNLFVGTSVNPPGDILIRNCALFQEAGTLAGNLGIGYVAPDPSQNLSIQDNFVMGGTVSLSVTGFQTANVTGNTLFGEDRVVHLETAGTPYTYTWDRNTYFNGKTANEDAFTFNTATSARGGGILMFDEAPKYDPLGNLIGQGWRQWTGFDSNTSYTYGVPHGANVLIYPNAYEPGRAHIAVYNWDDADFVDIDLSGCGLLAGQGYEIRSAQNFSGVPVLTGTYDPAAPFVPVPMNSQAAKAVATAFDHEHTPDSTCPRFAALVLLPGDTAIPRNKPPLVDAGPDQQITLPDNDADLSGAASDDGLPYGRSVTTAWSMQSGPGTFAFVDPQSLSTSATFSAAGTYVLELLADDGELAASDTVTVLVLPQSLSVLRWRSRANLQNPPDDVFPIPGLPWLDPDNVLDPAALPELFYKVPSVPGPIAVTKSGRTIQIEAM